MNIKNLKSCAAYRVLCFCIALFLILGLFICFPVRASAEEVSAKNLEFAQMWGNVERFYKDKPIVKLDQSKYVTTDKWKDFYNKYGSGYMYYLIFFYDDDGNINILSPSLHSQSVYPQKPQFGSFWFNVVSDGVYHTGTGKFMFTNGNSWGVALYQSSSLFAVGGYNGPTYGYQVSGNSGVPFNRNYIEQGSGYSFTNNSKPKYIMFSDTGFGDMDYSDFFKTKEEDLLPPKETEVFFNSFTNHDTRLDWDSIYNLIKLDEQTGTYTIQKNNHQLDKARYSFDLFSDFVLFNYSLPKNLITMTTIRDSFNYEYNSSQIIFSVKSISDRPNISIKVSELVFSFYYDNGSLRHRSDYPHISNLTGGLPLTPNYILYNGRSVTINNVSFNSIAEGETKQFKFDLAGYMDVHNNSSYLVEVFLDGEFYRSVPFTYKNVYGSNVSQDSSLSGIQSITPSRPDDFMPPGDDGLTPSLPDSITTPGTPSITPGSLNLNPEDLYGTLSDAMATSSSFFQFVWSIFPESIMSIIILSITLIIVLRVLGR